MLYIGTLDRSSHTLQHTVKAINFDRIKNIIIGTPTKQQLMTTMNVATLPKSEIKLSQAADLQLEPTTSATIVGKIDMTKVNQPSQVDSCHTLDRDGEISQDDNSILLEKQNQVLTDQLHKMELLIDQYKNDAFDQRELCECAKREGQDAGKRLVEVKRQVVHLENNLEYVKRKLIDGKGKSFNQQQEKSQSGQIAMTENSKNIPLAGQLHTAFNSEIEEKDFGALLAEKTSLLIECESLSAKIKLLEAQNRFALDQSRILYLQQIENDEYSAEVDEKVLINDGEGEMVEDLTIRFINIIYLCSVSSKKVCFQNEPIIYPIIVSDY